MIEINWITISNVVENRMDDKLVGRNSTMDREWEIWETYYSNSKPKFGTCSLIARFMLADWREELRQLSTRFRQKIKIQTQTVLPQ